MSIVSSPNKLNLKITSHDCITETDSQLEAALNDTIHKPDILFILISNHPSPTWRPSKTYSCSYIKTSIVNLLKCSDMPTSTVHTAKEALGVAYLRPIGWLGRWKMVLPKNWSFPILIAMIWEGGSSEGIWLLNQEVCSIGGNNSFQVIFPFNRSHRKSKLIKLKFN